MSNQSDNQSSFAFWGPSGAGKTWLLKSFARALTQFNVGGSRQDKEFNYTLTMGGQPVSPTAPGQVDPTQVATINDTRYEFKRANNDDSNAHVYSAQVHTIGLADAAGIDLQNLSDAKVNVSLRNADSVLVILDPILITSGAISIDEYNNMVSYMLNFLAQNPKKRSIAVCISKVDQLGVAGRRPEEVVDMFFGEMMLNQFKGFASSTEADIAWFLVSAMGYLSGQTVQPNFDPNTQYMIDPNNWKPYNVEQPFFWLFEQVERRRLEDAGSGLAKRFFGADRLDAYIQYPQAIK